MSKSDYDDEEGIVLEAGGELFTVGRCRLVQESALFRDLFALAGFHGPDRQDGTLESPVRTGDDPTMFRDFLWALRVRPAELMDFVESARTPEKAVKLTNVACLAHKYQDEGLAQWALRQLYNALSSTGFALEGAVLKPLLRTLALFDDGTASVKPLHGLLRSRAEAAQSATPNLVDLIGLVEACTTSGYMSLLPMAYYALLVSPLDIDWLDDTRLTESNKRHLMRGAYSLSEEWYRLRSRCPPYLEKKLPLSPQTRPADLLCKLRSIPPYASKPRNSHRHIQNPYRNFNSNMFDEDDGSSDDHQSCVKWRAEVDALLATFPEKLGDYFGLGHTSSPDVVS